MNSVWMVEERNKLEGQDNSWRPTGIAETVRETARQFKRLVEKTENDTFDFRITKYVATDQRG